MDGRRGQLLTFLGVVLAVTLVINDLLSTLASGSEADNVSYITHLVLLTAIIAYMVYLKHESFAAKYRLAVYRYAWRQIPCGIAVFRNNKLMEVCADAEMFDAFGMVGGEGEGKTLPPQTECGRLARTEEYQEPDGRRCYADRLVIPLTGFNGGGYTVELLVDASERENKIRQRDSEYVKMFRILVNMFEIKDPYSHGHSEVVSSLAQELAKALNLSEWEVDTIGRAALLHDIGKIIIPPDIMNKTGELSMAEYDMIKAHSCVGADILAGINLFRDEAAIVRHHHERFDGRGYPAGLAGSDIPLGSRIIAVVDAFDAMTAGRSVRGKRDVAVTVAVLEQEKGCQFDPEIVDVFLAMVKAERAPKR